MPVYKAPVDEVLFLLNDVFQISRYNNLPGFADASPDLLEPILGEAAKLCEEVVQPLNLPGDREGCKQRDHRRHAEPDRQRVRECVCGGVGEPSCLGARQRRRDDVRLADRILRGDA